MPIEVWLEKKEKEKDKEKEVVDACGNKPPKGKKLPSGKVRKDSDIIL